MRVNFRQGIVSHQSGSFLSINGSGHVDLLAVNKPLTVNLAHKTTDYIHSEDNTIQSAWVGPFVATDYWLYMDFNLLTFARTFGTTTIEPVAQSAEPGTGNALIASAVAGNPSIGFFVIPEHYVLEVGRTFDVVNSTANDGTYTVASSSFDGNTGNTTIFVNEVIPNSSTDGEITLDVDSSGIPLLIDGRHWYDTSTDTHYVRVGGGWSEVLRIFISSLNTGTFLSVSTDAPLYTGTQVGNTSSVLSGRVLFDETMSPLLRDNGEFISTEDQFFTNQSRVDGVRIESNVSKAQNTTTTLAAFTAVSYVGDGKIVAAQYDDIGSTVVGLLTEGIASGEVGSVVLQGVVTNPNWNWLTSNTVGQEMWIDNGIFVSVDPHIANPVTYPVGRVPVARILSDTSIIFEQGLGGKGDKGPTGSIADIPPATTSEIGGVTLLTASSNAAQAFAISDTDSRLADSRNPLPHVHQATDITFLPGFGISANNLQTATEELAVEKVNLSGGTMTGALILNSNPSIALEATTKQYVDNLVSGLIWLEPVDKINLISDVITTPPAAPEVGDAYIVPVGAVGDWAVFASGNVTTWDGSVWIDNGPVTGFDALPRFGIAFTTSAAPSGTFTGQKNAIAQYDATGTFIGFEVPVNGNAVYVRNILSESAFNQYAFNGSSWNLFSSGQNLSGDGVTITVSGNVMSVIPYSAGGTVDAELWQGLSPTDLNSLYASTLHTHAASTITTAPYTGTDWGTLTNTSDEITAAEIQLALQDITNNKASKMPTYATQAHLPAAGNVDGMIVYVQDIQLAYIASNGNWVPLVKQDDIIKLPYDLAFYVAGNMQVDNLVGSFMITRPITITIGAPSSLAIAGVAASDGPYTLDLIHKPSPTYAPVIVGTITFSIGDPIGIISWPASIDFVAGDLLQIQTPSSSPDTSLEEITITVVGCAPTLQCTI